MALKGPLWLMAKCLEEERKRSAITFLSSRALDLGIRKSESTRGHVFQACGAVQKFLIEHPRYKSTIRSSTPFEPYKLHGNLLRNWLEFLPNNHGNYGRATFGYNFDVLRRYLTPKYGGSRTGGGGGDNEFEIVFRLTAEFIN